MRKILLIDLFYLWENYVNDTASYDVEAPKNWNFPCSEPLKLSVQIGLKMKKLERVFFQEGNMEIIIHEMWIINKTIVQVVLQ